MAAITPIAQNLFRLYGHSLSRAQERHFTSQFPESATLDAIAFLLHQSGVNTIKLFVSEAEIVELKHPFLLLRSNPDGTMDALHYHNCTIHQLSPTLQPINALPGWLANNHHIEILAFDGEALQKAAIPKAPIRNRTKQILLRGAVLLLAVLLTAWTMRMPPMSLYNWVPASASLLVAFISVVLILKEIGLADNYTRPFCGKANYLGCSQLITSPLAANKWGISWSAAGLAHAATLPAYIIVKGPSADLLLMFTLLWQVPAIITATILLYKMWKLRTFCKLCLLVHTINFISFATVATLFSVSPEQYWTTLSLHSLLVFAGTALLTGWLVLTFYHALRTQKKLTAANTRSTDLTYGLLQHDAAADEAILQQLLQTCQPLPLYAETPGDERHPLLMVVSLHCTHCARLLQQLSNDQIKDNWKTSLLIAVDEQTPATGTKTLLTRLLQTEANPADRIRLLQDWYYTPDLTGTDEAALNVLDYPFCISSSKMLIEQLPGIFIAGKKLPHPLGADTLALALFTRLQQLEAQEE